MKTATRGNIGEAAVLSALTERHHNVLVPFGSGQPYDLVIDLGGPGFLRVQCKTAWRSRGCLLFNSYGTDHGKGRQPYFGLADVFGVFFPPDRSVYLVPVHGLPLGGGRLRLEPTRNNQRRRVRFAADFEINRWPRERLEVLAAECRALNLVA